MPFSGSEAPDDPLDRRRLLASARDFGSDARRHPAAEMDVVMTKKLNWLFGALLALAVAGCGDGGGSSGSSDPGGPSDGGGPTSNLPGQPPTGGTPGNPGGNPGNPKPPTPTSRPRTVFDPAPAGNPGFRRLPWEGRGDVDRPRTHEDVPGGFTNVPRPERPDSPTSPDPRLRGVGTDPSAGGPPVEPPTGNPGTGPGTRSGGDVPDAVGAGPDSPTTPTEPGGEPPVPPGPRKSTEPGAGGFTKLDPRDGGPTQEPPMPSFDPVFPRPDVPAVFAPRPGAPDAPPRGPKTPSPGELPEGARLPRPDGEGRRPGEPVPEPETYVLFALGAGFLVWTYRKHAARGAAGWAAGR